jgi:hypothetical protein
MNSNKDIFPMAFKISLFFALAAISASAATEDSTLVKRQSDLLYKLDSLNDAVLGFRVGGSVNAGVLSSKLTSDQLSGNSPSRESQAYTDANLVMTAHPSSETEARVEVRLHKDWQSGYEESVNPVIGHWFSYDGLILDKHLLFNLGYMRVGYTPLTLYVPEDKVLQEPEIFASRRNDALEMRNLDTSTNRLLQGLNVEYHSGAVGPVSDIYAQATVARIRNIAKKVDQLFFDFDWSDRYMMAANAGVSAYGFTVGGNFVSTFDRELSTRSRSPGTGYYYEDNYVGSGILGFDSKGIVDSPVHFGVNGEFAASKWKYTLDSSCTADSTISYTLKAGNYVTSNDGLSLDTISTYYVAKKYSTSRDWHDSVLERRNGTAFNIQPFVSASLGDFSFDVKGLYMQNDKKFWSEQASSRTYWGNTSILNSNALYAGQDSTLLSHFRSGSLENMYFAVYNTDVLQQQNLMSKNEDGDILSVGKESRYTYARLYNNYRLAHFYRNGYSATAYKLQEYAAVSDFIDPSVNMPLPMGLATPDRKGFAFSGNASWNDAVDFNLRFGSYTWDAIDDRFTQLGMGLGVDIAQLINYDMPLKLQGSFESASENKYLKRKTTRIVGGATIGIWGPVSVLAGVQMLNKKYDGGLDLYGDASVTVKKVEEMLILAGPQVKLGPGAYLNVEGGYMTNDVSYASAAVAGTQKLSIDKTLIMANVSVLF